MLFASQLRRALASFAGSCTPIERLEDRTHLTVLPLTSDPLIPGLLAGFATDSLTATNDLDLFEVDLVAGDRVTIEVAGAVNTRLELLNSDGGSIASDTDSGPGRNPLIANSVVGSAGRYRVHVIS